MSALFKRRELLTTVCLPFNCEREEMECQVVSLRSDRLKREDCSQHDSLFSDSDWKVVVGHSDWEDHSLGKEGAERYRVHNLPNCSSCPGVYELGIAITRAHSGRKIENLDPHLIRATYVGQTDNIRTRLQCYGRDGDHLENGNSNGQMNDYPQQGHRLFSEAFSKGYSIVYRWAPMKNKEEAEKAETRLLDTYDYAWNKGKNGVRRRGDVLQKLDGSTSSSIVQKAPLSEAKKLSRLDQKKIDVKIDTCKPLSWEDGSRISADWESNDFPPQIFKCGRSQPRLVTPSLGFNDDHSNICGVALGHGSVCTSPPVGGRKRCDAHKGMKINDLASKELLTEGKSVVNSSPSCGVTLDNGSVCRKPPVQGRVRCEDHKGRRITGSLSSESVTNGKTQHDVYGPVLEAPKSIKPQFPVYSENSVTSTKSDTICGMDLGNGTLCTKWPVVGRKRCEEHKGMRANESKLSRTVFDSPYGNSSARQSVPSRSVVKEDYYSSTCGATLVDGSACRRPPAEGLKRCWQHKGMRANTGTTHSFTSSYDTGGISSDICGASTGNGSICHRTPVSGRVRCEQHKGKRAAF